MMINTSAMHSYNIDIFICDIFFSVYVIQEVFPVIIWLFNSQTHPVKSDKNSSKVVHTSPNRGPIPVRLTIFPRNFWL